MDDRETNADDDDEDLDDGDGAIEVVAEYEEEGATEGRASGAKGNRQRAYYLRQKSASGLPLKHDDSEFLKAYDKANPPAAIGARASR